MTKSETVESMGTEAEGLIGKDVSVTSGNDNRSNPFILKIIPPDSDNLHEHGSGKELLLTPDVKYSVDSESVSWAGATQKTPSLKDSSRNAKKKKKKATVQNGEVRAPDGGWGWVVVFASMGISLVADGVSFSFGIIYIEFLRYFGASKSKTSVIGSLFMSVPLMAGPLASALVDRFGCRSMTILGGVVAAAGFVSSSLVDSIEVLCFTFGVLSGLGLALCYVTAVVCVAFWFDKKRSLANGLGVCGTGVGTFLFAPLTQALIDEYGWRGTTLILAGAFLQMCVCGAVMREPASGENAFIGQKESVETMEEGGGATSRLLPITSSFDERGSYSVSGRSAVSKRGVDSRGAVTLSLDDLPACVEINHTSPSLDNRGSGLSTSSLKPTVENKVPSYFFTDGAPLDLEDRKEGLDGNLISPAEKIAQVTRSPESSVTVAVNKMPSDAPKKRSVTKTINSQQTLLPVSPIVQLKGLRFRRNSITFRSDILYNNLYQPRALSCPDIYKSSPTPLVEEKKKAWYEDFLQIMADTMDVSMFLEWHFMLLSFSTFLLFTFFIVPYFYLAEHVIGLGYSESEASMLISIIGILNTIGMIALGWAGDQPWMNVTKTYALCLCLCGIFTGIMPLLTQSYPLLATASALFGLFFASNFSFTPVLIVELISLDRFTMAYGLILFTQGLGNLLGPPLAGWLYDITQTWNLSFYLAGFFIFISGLAIALITCTKNFTVGCSTAMKNTDVEENRG